MSITMLPIIGITMGDPAGIGPEICVKALEDKLVYEICRPIIIGDYSCIKNAAYNICNSHLQINPVNNVEEAGFVFGCIDVFDLSNVDIEKLPLGKVSRMAGNAAFESVKKAIELALVGKIDTTVTAPINKEAINAAGYHFAGHTEIYAHFTNTKKYSMLLAQGNLRVVHVSTHVSLRQACDLVKKDRIIQVIELADKVCRQMGIAKPRIAVAGLNPHCGENGLFGREEIEQIIPAIVYTREKGIDSVGPIAPDIVFSKAAGGMYDIVVAMYHDQGHISV
jgi:4-hydroxythreonine-4-phosphate dehydrogenase